MTREEKAIEASRKFGSTLYDSDTVSLTKDDMSFAFQLGIKWADNHPDFLWRNAKNDLPCFHRGLRDGTETKDVVTLDSNGKVSLGYMIYEFNKWRWNREDVTILFWFPIPALPEEWKDQLKVKHDGK